VTKFSISKVVFSQLLSQNNPLALVVGFNQNLYHQASCIKRKVLDISSVFHMKNLQDAGIDNVFFWINSVEKCTQSFPWCYIIRGKVMSSEEK
jgi:hypothetical protein